MESEKTLKECPECLRRLPIECFRSPVVECNDCRLKELEAERELIDRDKLKTKTKEIMTTVLDQNFLPAAGSPELMSVIGEVYQCYGGPRMFAQCMYDQMQEVMKRRPAPASSVSMLIQFMRLQMKLEETLRSQETADLTDEQLRREQELGLMKLILDTASDPKKRVMLDKLLQIQGIKLADIETTELLTDESKRSHAAD